MPYTLASLLNLYRHRADGQYGGEAVSQLEHALQCATLAEEAGHSSEAIAASLLHDLGHLVHHLGEDAAQRGIDDRHEHRAVPVLKQMFPAAVVRQIQLHVPAKRYLCAVDAAYWDSLSPTSKRSLELQGGVFSPEEAEQFIQQPHAREAVQLRRWDDLAKVADLKTPDLDHFLPRLQAAML